MERLRRADSGDATIITARHAPPASDAAIGDKDDVPHDDFMMISRWWLVPLDLIFGGRLGPLFAARDGFFAFRDSQKQRERQQRFDTAHRLVRDALQDRRALEDELLSKHGGR